MTVPSSKMHELPTVSWPPADRAAWEKACQPQAGRFGGRRQLSPFSYVTIRKGWAAYLWHLDTQGLLDRDATPAERARPDWLWGFYDRLVQIGNADSTILIRFGTVRSALRLMVPTGDFAFVTRLDGIPISRLLEGKRRPRFVPDSRHAALWAERLFCEALDLQSPYFRRHQIRDAVFLAIGATRAPRLRSLLGIRLGPNLRHSPQGWTLFFEEALLKGGGKTLELPLSPSVGAMVERYVAVERQELLGTQTHDYLWVNDNGQLLSRTWATGMVRIRSKKEFGEPFSPQRFRDALTTTQAVIDGTDPLGPSQILGHSYEVSLKNYNRATAMEASRQHDARIAEAEDAAERLLRRPRRKRAEATVSSFHELGERQKSCK